MPTIARLEKMTKKITLAMMSSDRELFDKWHRLIGKETLPGYFSDIYAKAIKQRIRDKIPHDDFMAYLIKHIGGDLKSDDWTQLLSAIFNQKDYKAYDIVYSQYGVALYKMDYFTNTASEKVLDRFSLYSFDHGLEDLLDILPAHEVTRSYESIPMFKMTPRMRDTLYKYLPEQKESLIRNLKSCIKMAKLDEIPYFFRKLEEEFSLDKDVLDACFMEGIEIAPKDERHRHIQERMREKGDMPLNQYMEGIVLTRGGECYKSLLLEYLFREKLQEDLEIKSDRKKMKI